MRVAILIEAILNRGGAERVVLTQATHYDADIYTAAYNPDATYPEFKQMRVNVIISGNIRGINHFRVRRAFSKLNLGNYDVIIGHNNSCLEAVNKNHPFIWYCHAPSRWSHDLYHEELLKKSIFMKIPFIITCAYLRWRDARNIKKIDAIATNSHNVKTRLQQYYPVDPVVIHPPIDIAKFVWLSQGDFYLSTARLDPIKRVDMVIEAFKCMPNKKIIIASSGPDESKLRLMAKEHNNILFVGRVSDQKLAELYGTCIALLSPSHKEDFGMVPLEANSAGKPVIAINEGGYKETVINGKTGILIDEPITPEKIVAAVEFLSTEKAASMRKACEEQAKLFSVQSFNEKMDSLVNTLVLSRQRDGKNNVSSRK